MSYLKPFRIGNVKVPNNLVLAPLAAVNCSAFRLMCANHGAGLTYTQMIDVDDISDVDERFIDRLKGEDCLSVQLIGSRHSSLKAATELVDHFADIIDINLGCAQPEMLGKQSGSFLLKHPEQIGSIVRAITDSTNKPVTAKIRSGWDKVNAVEVSKILEDLNVDAIAVHPRTKKQKYTGKADLNVIRKVKEAVSIPVIGNGDVRIPAHAKAMFESTGCDAVMVGRAAISNPLIFEQIQSFLESGEYNSDVNRSSMAKEFLDVYSSQKRHNFSEIKQHISWFFKGRDKELRRTIEAAKDTDSLKMAITHSRE